MNSTILIRLLKEKGYRITKSRQQIIGALPRSPSSAQEILDILKRKKIKMDLVTVYRSLELLTDIGVIQKIQFGDGMARFELTAPEDHHHHLICNKCGSVEDLSLNERKLLTQIKKQSDFKVQTHTLEFFGYCGNCQSV